MSELDADSTSRPIGKLPAFWDVARLAAAPLPRRRRRDQAIEARGVAAKRSRRLRRGTVRAPQSGTDDHVDRASRDLGAAQVRGPSNAARAHGARHRQSRLRGILDLSGRDQPGDIDDLRPVGDAGGPRRARPIGRVPPPAGRHRPVGDASGHQLRRSRAHRWSRPGAGAARPAAHARKDDWT